MSTLAAFVFSLIAAKWNNRRCLVTIIACIIPIIGAAIVYALPRSNLGGQMVGLYLLYTYFGPYVVGKFLCRRTSKFEMILTFQQVSPWRRQILQATPKRQWSLPSCTSATPWAIWSVLRPSEPVKRLHILEDLLQWLSAIAYALAWCVCTGRWLSSRIGGLMHVRTVGMTSWMALQIWQTSNKRDSATPHKPHEKLGRVTQWDKAEATAV